MKVDGIVNRKGELTYKCPFCRGTHTHGFIAGQALQHRVSHCGVNDESVEIHVRNFEAAKAS